MEIRRVGVVGCGLMGSGIAQVAATAGFPTVVREVSADLLDKGLASIEKSLKKLVELVKTVVADAAVVQLGRDYARRVGKIPILTSDRAGFIVNRLLVPYLLDAIRALEEGFGTIEDIDNGMKLGCNHPMGPLTLLDFVGIETTYYIAEILFNEYRERRFAPPPLMKRMVLAGMDGRKSAKGFHDYTDPKNPKPNNLLVG